MKTYSYSLQGRRNTQEDEHVCVLNLDNSDVTLNNINFFGVFDGHGGKTVSTYLKNNLPQCFLNNNNKLYQNSNSYIKYINQVYNSLQNNLKTKHPKAVEYCGSTACIVILFLNKKGYPELWIINVGDSRAMLCNNNGEPVQLSIDHKPNLPEEKSRIESLGGKIKYDGSDWRINNLSLSRSFGDLDCTPYVTHLPNIYKYKLKPLDKFIVLACDGLWDVLTNEMVVEFIKNLQFKNFKGNYAKELACFAYDQGSYDNITVLIYFF